MAVEGNGDLPVPDLQTMEELCQPSLNGRGGPIAPIAIQEMNFGLKNDMIKQVHNSCQFNGLSSDDANKHLDKFLHVTQSIKVNGVADDALRLYLFPHYLIHHATAWFDHLLRNLINTFEQMAKMFLGKDFPPSMVTKLRNEITNFRQRPDESLFESWERYKLSIDRCPNHNMLPITQIYTFFNGLTLRHCETINAAARGTFMKRHPEEFYDLIENMTTHHNNWDTSAQWRIKEIIILRGTTREETNSSKELTKFMKMNTASSSGLGTLPGNTMTNPKEDLKVVTTNEFTNFMKANDAILNNIQTNNTSLTNSNLELKNMFGQFMKMNTASSSGLGTLPGNTMTNPKEDLKGIITQSGTAYQGPTIPTTSSPPVVERETEATKDMVHPTNNGSTKDVQPLVVLTESPILNSERVVTPIIEPVASPVSAPKPNQRPSILTPLNEHCLAVLLKKLPEKLRDPSKFLIPCDFPGMAECLSLADLGVNINLMPFSVRNNLYLLYLSPTCMTLELTDRLISYPVGIVKDVFIKVDERALIDVFEGELTFRVGKEAITFNLDQTSSHSANYNDMTENRINIIDMAYEEYSDFLLEEVDAFQALEDDPTSSEVDQSNLDSEGDILLLEAFLNDDPSLPPLNQGNYLPNVRKELKICDATLPVIITKDLSVESKTALISVLKSHKRAIAWKLSNIKEKMLKRCEDTNLLLNWEKSHFMVKE
nr:reverse transcriptase domain-containing protein [Tanacetum cinerariifolium]